MEVLSVPLLCHYDWRKCSSHRTRVDCGMRPSTARVIVLRSTPFTLAFTLLATRMTLAQMTPSQTVQAAFDAFRRSDWPTLASLIHPDALTAFRTHQLGSAVGYTLLRSDPQIRNRNISITPADFVSVEAIQKAKGLPVAEFPGAPTIGALAGLSPRDFFVRWCEAAFRNAEHRPWPATQGVGRQIIGELIEGDTLAHVLYRQQVESIWLAGKLDVMSLKQVGGHWLILLNDDVIWRFPLVGPQ